MSNVIDSRRMSIVARLEVNEGGRNQKIKNKGKERCNEKRKRKEKEYIKSQKETRHAQYSSIPFTVCATAEQESAHGSRVLYAVGATETL